MQAQTKKKKKTTAAVSPPAGASPAPAPAQQEQDILYQLKEIPAASATFAPLYSQRSFWLAQLLPLIALIGWVVWRRRQAHLADREAQRTAQLHHEAAELQRKLQRDGGNAEQYFADASRAVQLRTALARNVDPNVVDADAAASAFRLDEQARARMRQLFQRHDELRYSGGPTAGGQSISAENRREILELVESLQTR